MNAANQNIPSQEFTDELTDEALDRESSAAWVCGRFNRAPAET